MKIICLQIVVSVLSCKYSSKVKLYKLVMELFTTFNVTRKI